MGRSTQKRDLTKPGRVEYGSTQFERAWSRVLPRIHRYTQVSNMRQEMDARSMRSVFLRGEKLIYSLGSSALDSLGLGLNVGYH